MPPSNEPDAAWLHALWGQRATLSPLAEGGRAILSGRDAGERVLHLPSAIAAAAVRRAAAAHAAAHWRFGAPAQPRAALKPVQQALFGVLEDARVEALAMRELPGLRALWLPFHAGPDAPAGNGFEALLARLARSLLDPAHADPHPWVERARAAFLAGDGSAAAVREAASRLGHEIGQMRLPFNPRTHAVHALYRDDGSWLWEFDADLPASDTPLAADALPRDGAASEALDAPAEGAPTRYAEWDARIGRYRADWCSVYVLPPPATVPARGLPRVPAARVARVLAVLPTDTPRHAGRAAWGEEFHAMALVDAQVQWRTRQAPDARVYRRRVAPSPPMAVQVLLDTSASTGQRTSAGRTWLEGAASLALGCAARLEAAGHDCSLLAFASRTRHRVELRPVKHWHEAAGARDVAGRAAALRGSGSTRTGGALRHAAALALARARGEGRHPVVLLFSDGEAHDVDVPDAAYLRADLRRAIAEAERAGIAVRCVGRQPSYNRVHETSGLHPWPGPAGPAGAAHPRPRRGDGHDDPALQADGGGFPRRTVP